MTLSTMTTKGRTTILGRTRKALLRVHPGTRALKGALASKKGKGMSFSEIREAAAKAVRSRKGVR